MGSTLGKSTSYVLNGRYIKNPIQFYLIADKNFIVEQVSKNETLKALNAALATWNKALGKTAFLPVLVANEINENISWFAWEDIGTGTLAYSNSFCNEYGMLERGEITFNSRTKWSTSPKNAQVADIMSTAIHESGHNVGLGDLYKLPRTDPRRQDLRQVMSYVAGIKRTLGAGDITGAKRTLYHKA